MRRAAVWALLAASAGGQVRLPFPADAMVPSYAALANLDFEKGTPGQAPPEWSLVQESRIEGYSAEWRAEGCHGGRGCVVLSAGPQSRHNEAGGLMQQCSAERYRGKRMRLRAWVKLTGARKNDRIRVAFTADGEDSTATFMQKSGANAPDWTLVKVDGKVPLRAEKLTIVVTMTGKGQAWIDDVELRGSAVGHAMGIAADRDDGAMARYAVAKEVESQPFP